ASLESRARTCRATRTAPGASRRDRRRAPRRLAQVPARARRVRTGASWLHAPPPPPRRRPAAVAPGGLRPASIIGAAVDVQLARQQWEDGTRRLERMRSDPAAYARLAAQVEFVARELGRRVGQTFTLEELARAYDGADDWARDLLDDARDEGSPLPDT